MDRPTIATWSTRFLFLWPRPLLIPTMAFLPRVFFLFLVLQVKLWTPSSGYCFVTFDQHTAAVVDLAFVPHGTSHDMGSHGMGSHDMGSHNIGPRGVLHSCMQQ